MSTRPEKNKYSGIRRYIACGLLLLTAVVGMALTPVSTPLEEIKQLFATGKYSIVLEKSLGILNAQADRLSPVEGAFLYYYVGLAYKKNGNNELAAEYLQKIETQYPASEYVKLALMELADIHKDDYFRKESYLEKVYEEFPKTPEALDAGVEMCKGYLRLKNFRKALPVLETIVNLWKKGEEKPELFMLMAVAYAGINDYIEARDYLIRTEQELPGLINGNPFYQLEAGKIYYNSANFKKTIVYLESLINTFSDYKDISEASVLLALAYEKENKPFLSAVFLIKAIQKKPAQKQLHTLYLNLGRILNNLDERSMNKIKQNYPLLSNSEKLLTIVKNNSLNFEERKTAAILLSDEYKKNNKMVKSLDNFYKFLGTQQDPLVEKLFKENLDAYIHELGKKKDHRELFEAWVKLKDRKSYLSPQNLLRFGEILFQVKMYVNAGEIYRHIIKYRMYSEYWPTAMKQLARIDFQLGKYDELLELLGKLDVKKEPELSEFNYYKIQARQNVGQAEAVTATPDPGGVDLKMVENKYQFDLLRVKVGQLDKRKEYEEALELCRIMDGFAQATEADRIQLSLTIADLHYKKGELEESLAEYQRTFRWKTATKDNKEWILFRIVSIYRKQGKVPEEEEALKQLREMSPNSFWLRQLDKNVR